jgi:hypothetical protein
MLLAGIQDKTAILDSRLPDGQAGFCGNDLKTYKQLHVLLSFLDNLPKVSKARAK